MEHSVPLCAASCIYLYKLNLTKLRIDETIWFVRLVSHFYFAFCAPLIDGLRDESLILDIKEFHAANLIAGTRYQKELGQDLRAALRF